MSDQTEANQSQADQTPPDVGGPTDPAAVEPEVASEAPLEGQEKTPEELAKEKAEKLKEAISIQTEEKGTLRQRLTISVPRSVFEERLDEQFEELQRERDIRGFRRGRAPRRLVEKTFGSEVNDAVKDQVVGEAYLAAVDKQGLKVLGDPDLDFEKIKLPAEGDLQFSCEVEIKPEFQMPELKAIPIRRPVIQITDGDVDQQIERLRMRSGHYDPVEGGTVQPDDVVVADVKLTIGDAVVTEESNVQFAARPSRIEGIVVDKLGEALVGAKAGDERDVEAVVPDDHEKEEHRGKKAQIHIKVHDIKRLVLPPLDDSLAQTMGFENLAELRTMIRAESESRLDQEIRRGMRAQIRQYLLANTQLEIPPALGSRQTERVVARQLVELQRQGVPDVEIEKHLDELRTTAHEQAVQEVKAFFILEKVAEDFEIDVTEDELNGQVAQIARSMNRRFDRVRDELMNRGALQALYISIREDKCLDRLLEEAQVTEVTPEQENKAGKAEDAKKGAADLADET
jgi:trigger factor